MKKKEAQRGYHFPDAELITTGNAKIAFMRRDSAAFETYGIDATAIDSLETAIETFTDNISDVELAGRQVLSTEATEAKAEQLREGIRGVMSRVALKHNVDSTQYKMFGTELLSRQTDSNLLLTAKRVCRLGTEGLAIYSANGLNAGMLAQIITVREELDDLMVDQKIKIGIRDNLQEDRVEEGNAIYKILSAYASTGMSIWVSSDVAKYNDYIIYNTPSGTASVEPTV